MFSLFSNSKEERRVIEVINEVRNEAKKQSVGTVRLYLGLSESEAEKVKEKATEELFSYDIKSAMRVTKTSHLGEIIYGLEINYIDTALLTKRKGMIPTR